MLTSICAPLYNHESYVKQCLLSIASQNVEKELLIVDDHSTDNSLQVVNEIINDSSFRREFKRIILDSNLTNRGAHYCLNKTAFLAHGDHVTFINTDDFYGDDRLVAMLETKMPFVFTSIDFAFSSDVCNKEKLYWRNLRNSSESRMKMVQPQSWAFTRWQHSYTTGNILIRRDIFNRVGGFRNLRYCHDWDFFLRAILLVEPAYIPDRSYFYRLHAGNTFRSLSNVAQYETRLCLRNYLFGLAENTFCLHPSNFRSDEFLLLISGTPLADVIQALVGLESPEHRTINYSNIERLRRLRYFNELFVR